MNQTSTVKVAVPVASVFPKVTRSSTPSNLKSNAGGVIALPIPALAGRRSSRSSIGIPVRAGGSHVDDPMERLRSRLRPGAASTDRNADLIGAKLRRPKRTAPTITYLLARSMKTLPMERDRPDGDFHRVPHYDDKRLQNRALTRIWPGWDSENESKGWVA